GFKNQLVKVNAANGEVLWDATFRGIVEKELVTRKPIVDLWIKGDKLFFWLDGIQVFNLNNGQKLWEVDYESDMDKTNNSFIAQLGGKSGQKKIYRTLADPIFTEDAVYIVIFAGRSRTKYVEK